MKSRFLGLAFALALAGSSAAHAAVVKVWGEELGGFSRSTINSFYNGLGGHSSTIANGTLDTVSLAGVNLLWATQPGDAYTLAELSTMSSFLAGGGRIAFLGEHGFFGAAQNTRINAALSALGSTISITNDMHDPGFRTASVGDGQILSHALTTGVSSYEYAAYAPLSISGSAVALMIGEDQTSIMMAYQNIGPGSIFLITDQNVWDNAPTWGNSFNNARMFENLLSGNTGAPSVPDGGPGLWLGATLIVLGVIRRAHRR